MFGLEGWYVLLVKCDCDLDVIEFGLYDCVNIVVDVVVVGWFDVLFYVVIYGDLFFDNVLMFGDCVIGLIDFYFVCIDICVYDLVVMYSVWVFDVCGEWYDVVVGMVLVEGYVLCYLLFDVECLVLLVLV